eukprot:1181044-Prorocentrum_minimum.AAC.1
MFRGDGTGVMRSGRAAHKGMEADNRKHTRGEVFFKSQATSERRANAVVQWYGGTVARRGARFESSAGTTRELGIGNWRSSGIACWGLKHSRQRVRGAACERARAKLAEYSSGLLATQTRGASGDRLDVAHLHV